MLTKRTLALTGLSLSMMLFAAACGGSDNVEEAEPTTVDTAVETEEAPVEEEPAEEEPAEEAPADSNEPVSGTIAGAGASSQAAAMQAWVATFTGENTGATINYDPVGSGGGREQFLAGAVNFAGSDAALKPEEIEQIPASCGQLIQIPGYISPIAIAFNVEGVDSLNLKPDTLARIFMGEITNWNDEAIAADNEGTELPDLPINPVHRGDGSGTTENFMDYLTAAAGDVWTFEADKEWPAELGGEAAQQTSGVVSAIGAGNGSIGYADASQVGDLSTVAIGVGGDFVNYSPEAAAKVVEASPRTGSPASDYDYSLELDRDAEGGYPIVLVSYELACTQYDDAEVANLVKAFLSYVVSAEGQDIAAQAAGSAPLSSGLREKALTGIDSISAS